MTEFYNNELKWIDQKGADFSKIYNEVNGNNAITNNINFTRAIGTNYTQYLKEILAQKYYTVTPSDYIEVRAGQIGAYADQYIITAFEQRGYQSGMVSRTSPPVNTPTVDLQMEQKEYKVSDWKYHITYNDRELVRAGQSQTVDLDIVRKKEEATFRNFQMDVQRMAFLGSNLDGGYEGLLNQSNVAIDATTIDTPLSDMTVDTLDAKVKSIIKDTRNRLQQVDDAMPNMFVIPQNDLVSLKVSNVGVEASINVTKFDFILKKFRAAFGQDFEIKGLAYSDEERNSLGSNSGVNRYVLYRKDGSSQVMHITRNYTTTSYDRSYGECYTCTANASFGGLNVHRPHEMAYFDQIS